MNYIKIISKLILLGLSIVIVSGMVQYYMKNYYGYEYLSMKDEFGISGKCYMNDKGLFCKTKDGLVSVKQFRKR